MKKNRNYVRIFCEQFSLEKRINRRLFTFMKINEFQQNQNISAKADLMEVNFELERKFEIAKFEY